MQETHQTWGKSLGQKDALEKEMAIHSSILAWEVLWTEESGGLQSKRLQRIAWDWAHGTIYIQNKLLRNSELNKTITYSSLLNRDFSEFLIL